MPLPAARAMEHEGEVNFKGTGLVRATCKRQYNVILGSIATEERRLLRWVTLRTRAHLRNGQGLTSDPSPADAGPRA